MKRIVFIVIALLLTTLSSCVSFELRNLPESFTEWSSTDDAFSFQIQGLSDYVGHGEISLTDETIEVYVLINVIQGEVYLHQTDTDDIHGEPYLTFDIEKGSLDGKTMTLVLMDPETDEIKSDALRFDMEKRILTEDDDFDAIYYIENGWENKDLGWELLQTSGFMVKHQMLGYIQHEETKISILFTFKEQQTFEITNNGVIFKTYVSRR